MGERCCRYCEKAFQPSKYQPQQEVCSEVGCQKRRRSEYRQQKLKADEEYRQVCRDSSRKWCSQNPDYWRQYRQKHPESVAQNREKQQARDRRHHMCDLANNISALDLKHSAAAIWLLNGEAAQLANNNSVSGMFADLSDREASVSELEIGFGREDSGYAEVSGIRRG